MVGWVDVLKKRHIGPTSHITGFVPCRALKGSDQHLELHPERNWKPVQFTEQRNYMGKLRAPHYVVCILNKLKFPGDLQGHVEHIAEIQMEDDQGMSYHEQSLL